MATYFRKYYFEFTDEHVTVPATWRVDIYDSEGDVPTEPFLLTASGTPLITERINTSEDKFTYIIGRQITISYEYTGVTDPLPEMFFEASEKRFKVEVRKNGIIDGVYYIKPDYSQSPDQFPPFTVQLKAIDGFGYAEGTNFNIYDDQGLLVYDKMLLYDMIYSRSLSLITEPGMVLNVANTLKPDNIITADSTLFGLSAHSDMFYDFLQGPDNVNDVLMAFCKEFTARIFTARNEIWFIRNQDLTGVTLPIEKYIDGSTMNIIAQDFVITGGPDPSAFDVMPVDIVPVKTMQPAIKKAEFEVTYKSINQLTNFDWRTWDGTNFAGWTRSEQGGNPLIIDQTGSGTALDPFKLYFQYDPPIASQSLDQETGINTVFPGDIIEISFRYRFTNSTTFYIRVKAGDDTELYVTMDEGGGWQYTFGTSPGRVQIKRSGNKRQGSFTIKTSPVPTDVVDDFDFPTNSTIEVSIGMPQDQNTMDDPFLPGAVEIYPIKMGIIALSDDGRHITITNTADFTQTKETESFNFIDTGEDGVSNTIFIAGTNTPAANWDSDKPSVNPADIERHMAQAYIDQYQRSVTTWEGNVYSNDLEFYQVIEFAHITGKRFMQLGDVYDNRTCTHQLLLGEVFEEGTASVEYLEYDIEDEPDE